MEAQKDPIIALDLAAGNGGRHLIPTQICLLIPDPYLYCFLPRLSL